MNGFRNCGRKVLATFRGGERNMRYPLMKNVIVWGSTMIIIIPLKKRKLRNTKTVLKSAIKKKVLPE